MKIINKLKIVFLKLLLFFGGERLSWKFWKGKGLVLSFHGVLPVNDTYQDYPYRNFVFISDFRSQMAYLKKECNLMSLREMFECIQRNAKLPERSVAVTFDDGYKNNFELAAPILLEHNIPATFFVASGFVGKDKMIVAEEMKMMLFYSSEGRKKIQPLMRENGVPQSKKDIVPWIQNAISHFKTAPEYLSTSIFRLMKQSIILSDSEFKKKPFEFMSISNLKELCSYPIFEIGAHTKNHKILSRMSAAELKKELLSNKIDLEKWTNRDINLFAYPNGLQKDFTLRDQEALIQTGFQLSCTEEPGYFSIDSKRYEIPRIDIGQNHSLTVFRAYVSGLIPILKRIK